MDALKKLLFMGQQQLSNHFKLHDCYFFFAANVSPFFLPIFILNDENYGKVPWQGAFCFSVRIAVEGGVACLEYHLLFS